MKGLLFSDTCVIESKIENMSFCYQQYQKKVSRSKVERSVFGSTVNDSTASTMFVHIAAGGYICMCINKKHNMQHRSNTYIYCR